MRDERSMPLVSEMSGKSRPACVGSADAAAVFGWPEYYLPILMRSGHLKPLGKPAQNSRKWFSTVDLERKCNDPDWLSKAILIVERVNKENNIRQKTGKFTQSQTEN